MKTDTVKKEGSIGSKHNQSQLMHKLFEKQLKDIYWAEKELTRFMPEFVKKIQSEELVDVIEEHMDLTKQQVSRLEDIFKIIGSKAEAVKCEAMAGLIKEAEDITKSAGEGAIRDAFIIGAVQKVEHYETASYGTLKALAGFMGLHDVASLLGETLKEEKEADEKLTDIAENIVNLEAARESGSLDEEEEEEFEEEEESAEDTEEEEFEGRSGRKSTSKTHH
jgi:ferritin-like metal-binding protein YciE